MQQPRFQKNKNFMRNQSMTSKGSMSSNPLKAPETSIILSTIMIQPNRSCGGKEQTSLENLHSCFLPLNVLLPISKIRSLELLQNPSGTTTNSILLPTNRNYSRIPLQFLATSSSVASLPPCGNVSPCSNSSPCSTGCPASAPRRTCSPPYGQGTCSRRAQLCRPPPLASGDVGNWHRKRAAFGDWRQ